MQPTFYIMMCKTAKTLSLEIQWACPTKEKNTTLWKTSYVTQNHHHNILTNIKERKPLAQKFILEQVFCFQLAFNLNNILQWSWSCTYCTLWGSFAPTKDNKIKKSTWESAGHKRRNLAVHLKNKSLSLSLKRIVCYFRKKKSTSLKFWLSKSLRFLPNSWAQIHYISWLPCWIMSLEELKA